MRIKGYKLLHNMTSFFVLNKSALSIPASEYHVPEARSILVQEKKLGQLGHAPCTQKQDISYKTSSKLLDPPA